jgi:serine/threonine protein phosphatase PrpC
LATVLPPEPAIPDDVAARADGASADVPLPGGGRLLVASRRGRLHAHRGDHREDAMAWRTGGDGWCVAVADGAGSAVYSRVGAHVAAQVVVHEALRALRHGHALSAALSTAADAVQAALDTLAAQAPCAPRDLRTTLLVAVGTGERLALMQVGDGAIVCEGPTPPFRQPIAPHSGTYSGEVAHFLPDAGAVDALRASILELEAGAAHTVLLATDGVEDPWYPLARHAPALLASLAGEAAPMPEGLLLAGTAAPLRVADGAGDALLQWLAFEKRGENDDRTLAVVRCPGAAG